MFRAGSEIPVFHYLLENSRITEIKNIVEPSGAIEIDADDDSADSMDLPVIEWELTNVCSVVIYPVNRESDITQKRGAAEQTIPVGRSFRQTDFRESVTPLKNVLNFAPAVWLEQISLEYPDCSSNLSSCLYIVVMLPITEYTSS